MAEEQYKDYLAARVLTEHKPVTYRLLSRAVNTNVNTAKQSVQLVQASEYQLTGYRMLFEFHKSQNARKPNSVHATYLVTGTPRRTEKTNGAHGRKGEDANMRSSPFMSSIPAPEEPVDSDYISESDDEDTPAPKGVKETQIVLVREEDLERAFRYMLLAGPY
jgi:DNA polymerase delta subunit 3